ncbi:MAG: FAD-dependent oxidoreductase [Synechococcus sp.]|tara:strand:+ start:255 stop:1403 length:1149 start_codon:yes stop_codon:yes gene_type:complete
MTSPQNATNSVVVVGGGFGGLFSALAIRERLPERPVVVLEPHSNFVFQPHLYELLSGEMQSWEVAPRYRDLLSSRQMVWLQERVNRIDLDAGYLTTDKGSRLEWGDLILATGTEPNDFGIPGVSQHAQGFHNLNDVATLRERIHLLRQQRKSDAALVIVGAGPTGVELACKLADLLEGSALIHLIEVGDEILARSRSFNRTKAQAALERRQIRLHLNTSVTAVQDTQVQLAGGTSLRHDGLIWSGGSRPSLPPLKPESLVERRGISINSDLRVSGQANVFAIGDSSHHAEAPWPGTAQVAMQQGEAVAAALAAMAAGQEPEPFEFQDRGEMLSLGLGDATLTGLGITLAGPLAFNLRRATYLTRLPGMSLGLRSAGAWLLNR